MKCEHYQMQTMDMGSAEAAITQIAAVPPASSSSYFLQLDPSGHIDILDSPLVLAKPEMVDETVYEIQLDPFAVEDQKVEVVNFPNFQNAAMAFQQDILGAHNNILTTSFDPSQIQYQIDSVSLNHMLMNGGTFTAVLAPQQTTPVPIPEAREMSAVESVPEFTIETEVHCETNNEQGMSLDTSNLNMQDETIVQQQSCQEASVNEMTVEKSEDANVKGESENQEKSETTSAEQKPAKTKKWEFPEKLWEFNEDPVLPPVKVIYPSNSKSSSSSGVEEMSSDRLAVADTPSDEENMTPEGEEMEADEPFPSEFLPQGIDPDDELYISYLKRPDETKTAMCILCYEWFDSGTDLEAHLNAVHRDNMILYSCKRCGKQFWSRFMRQRHEKLHRYDLKGPIQRYFPKNRPFDYYESKHFLKRLRPAPFTKDYIEKIKKIQSQVKSTEYECIQCDKFFRNEEEYQEHYEENHALQTCIHCREVFDNAKLLRKHEQNDHGMYQLKKNYPGGAWKLWESEWDCDELKEKDEKIVSVYLYHNYSKRKTDEKKSKGAGTVVGDQFFTSGCQEVTLEEYDAAKKTETKKKAAEEHKKSKGSSKSERKSHSSGSGSSSEPSKGRKHEPKPALLSDPDEEFDRIEFFENIKLAKPGSKAKDLPFKCDACRTSFDNDIDLQRHIKSHSLRAMAYMCQYCGRGFATHSNRKEHERIHTGDKPYVCPICARAFVQISNLKKHIQTHKDKNNLQCTTCSKQFVKESSLILHQRAHSQDRKFRCHICDRAYNYASLLKRHMRIHTGENPYSCDDCGMQFHELVSLHYHRKKVHTGERPHRCEECGRAFILSSDLKKHLKIHQRTGTPNTNANASITKPSAKSGSSRNASPIKSVPVPVPDMSETFITPDEAYNSTLEQSNADVVTKAEAPLMTNYITSDGHGLGHSISDGSSHQILVISDTDLLKTVKNETTKVEVITNETKENCLVLSGENHVEPIP